MKASSQRTATTRTTQSTRTGRPARAKTATNAKRKKGRRKGSLNASNQATKEGRTDAKSRKATKARAPGEETGVRRRTVTVGARGSSRKGTRATVSLAGFPKVAKGEGCGATFVVAERAGTKRERVTNTCEFVSAELGSRKRTEKTRSSVGGVRGFGPAGLAEVCRALATLGHVERLRLMLKLLEGPATYRTLERVTHLKVGPLYHHVNQLRLAGLILPKQRDLYELTRGGRNLALAAVVVGPMARDARRRPLA